MKYTDGSHVESNNGVLEMRESVTRFEDLECWQLARRLCQMVHEVSITGAFAKDFALRDQISRASGSSMDNAWPVK